MRYLSALFLVFLCVYPVHAVITLDASFTKDPVLQEVRVIQDPKQTVTLNELIRRPLDSFPLFSALPPQKVRAGKEWYLLEFHNSTEHPLEWVFSNPRMRTEGLQFHHIVNDGNIESVQNKSGYAYLSYPTVYMEGVTPANGVSRIIIEADFGEAGFVYRQFDLYSTEMYQRHLLEQAIIKGIGFGGLLIIFLYNLFLLFSLRTRSYFWYVVYMGAVLMLALNINGIGQAYLWGWSEYVTQYIFMMAYPFVFIAALQFSRVFLQTKERHVLIDRILVFFMVFFAIALVASLSGFKEYGPKFFFLGSLFLCFLPWVGAYFWYRGYKEARFYVIAWSAWALGMFPMIVMFIGYDFTYETVSNAGRIGLWFEAALLSFALADRIRILRDQRDRAVSEVQDQKIMLEVQSRFAQMGEMIAGIGHQWSQPLTVISMMAGSVKDSLEMRPEKVPQNLYEDMGRVEALTHNMNKTLVDFKNFFSPHKYTRCFHVYESVQTFLSMIGRQYAQENIKVIVKGDKRVSICGQENEFQQVIANLLNNARDVLLERKISKNTITVEIVAEQTEALISVQDHAGGIPEEITENIFDQYFTTKGEKGTGIGLYLCKMIVEQNFKGTINVSNREGGARFELRVPLGDETKAGL